MCTNEKEHPFGCSLILLWVKIIKVYLYYIDNEFRINPTNHIVLFHPDSLAISARARKNACC